MLETLGISAQADAIYRSMLANRTFGVDEIANQLSLTREQVLSGLDELASHRLLRPDSSGGWQAVHPTTGLSALLAQAEAAVAARQREIEATRAAIAAISAEHATYDRDAVLRLEGVEAVRSRLEELAAQAKHECVSFNPNSAQTPDAKQASKPVNQRLLERGVAIRCIYQDSFRNDPQVLAYARWLASLGGLARTVPALPMMMVIFDGQTALLPLDPSASAKGALEITSPGVVAAACALFEQMWATGIAFGEQHAPEVSGLDPAQQHMLRLLSAGHTDEAVSRALGVSLSTIRRMMAVLMERLGARSRFQAGVHAAERGWLKR